MGNPNVRITNWDEMSGGSVTSTAASLAYSPSITFTRPQNATAYTAGDVVGVADSGTPANAGSAIHTLESAGPAGGSVVILGGTLTVNLTAIPSGMTTFRLYLFNASPAAILDNAALALAAADRSLCLGFIDFPQVVDVGAFLLSQGRELNKDVKLGTGDSDLYGVLVTDGAFTPASATEYSIRLNTVAV